MCAQSRKRTKQTSPGQGGWQLVAVVCLLLTACAATSASPSQSIRTTSNFSASPLNATFTERPIPLMNSPKDVRQDYVYPMTFMRQKLVWSQAESLWHMTFPTRRYAYAGIELRKPVDLAAERDYTRLSFRMRPARLAPFLSVALLDGSAQPSSPQAMTDFWLQEHGTFSGDGWVTVEIALTNFPNQATTLIEDSVNPMNLEDPPRRPFNWASIQEVRFVSGGGRIPSQEIVVKNLRFLR